MNLIIDTFNALHGAIKGADFCMYESAIIVKHKDLTFKRKLLEIIEMICKDLNVGILDKSTTGKIKFEIKF